MSLASTVVSFGEWLPDQPKLGNTGLTVADNVLPCDGGYEPFYPLDTSLSTLPATVSDAAFGCNNDLGYLYAFSASSNVIYTSVAGGPFSNRGTMPGSGDVNFAQFDDLMLITNNGNVVPYKHTIGSVSNITVLSAATLPSAAAVAVVNRFAVIANLLEAGTPRPNVLRWSEIDNPSSWPTPNSATAIATQAGEQILNMDGGAIQAITSGDQFAVIFQRRCVRRMTYAGPPVVFQFDTIDTSHGLYFPKGFLQVGNVTYFISDSGLCKTDGVSVQELGVGKVNRTFMESIFYGNNRVVNMGYEPRTGLIYIGYNTQASSFDIDSLLIYNPKTDKFTRAAQDMELLVTPPPTFGVSSSIMGFGTQANSVLGRFNGTPGTAVIATGDAELNTAGRSFVAGVKPHIESSGTAPAVTVRLGYRNDVGSTPTYTATTTPTTRTGFADFRVDAKYHRAEVQIVGTFTRATGVEFSAAPSGKA